MSDFSIHIVTHNSAVFLESCLAGIDEQIGVDFSIVVFDNASSDETCRILREKGVRVIESPVNIGYAAAHNRLIEQMQTSYVLTLNPDVRLQPGFLSEMQSELERNPRLGSAAGYLLRIEAVDDAPRLVDGMGLYMRRNRRQGLIGDATPIGLTFETSESVFGPDGAAAVYRRAMLEDIRIQGEYFDEDFFLHKEDVDICWRAQLRGWESAFVPKAVAHHIRNFRPGVRKAIPSQMRATALRNRYLLMIKNEIPRLFLRDLPWILLYEVKIFAYALLFERDSLQAYAGVWRLRKRMLEKRHVIQRQKQVGWRDMRSWFR